MTPERWERAQDLFSEAVALPAPERRAFLARACGADASLHAELASLLTAYESDPGFLAEPVARVPSPAAHAPAAAAMPERIGPYRVLRRIGEGGMGAIFLASRDDDQFQREVALKLVKRGMDTDDILRRFRHERQILAALDHPGIARLFDGGASEDGRPYFVMEYVADGVPIDTYCRTRALGIDERLRLFQQAAHAVHYAHQNLIVHRDLKPSNILVTADGQVKLLDFGIAKLLDPARMGLTAAPTRTALRLLTPDYASPEQLVGAPVTTASDVYALGVLLYELLAGRRPFGPEPTRDATPPPRPSTVLRLRAAEERDAELARRARTVGAELDTIVQMAMHPEPGRRYASAEALADDVRRYLEGLPVAARPDTVGYRVRKFVQRHRAGVGVVVASFVLVAAFGAVMAVQAERIGRQARALAAERDRARHAAERAEQVSGFLVDLFRWADPVATPGGGAVTARELLDRGARRIQADLAAQPEVQASLLDVLATTYANLGDYPTVVALAESSLAVRQRVYPPEHPEVAQGVFRIGEAHLLAGQLALAERELLRALALQRSAGVPHGDVARTLTRLSRIMRYNGDAAAAEAAAREALQLYRAQGEADTPDYAEALYWLGHAVSRREPDEAERYFAEVVDIRRRRLGPSHPELAWALVTSASLQTRRGDPDGAEPIIREALAMHRRAYGDDHPDVSRTLAALARVHAKRGEWDEAAELYRRIIAIRERAMGADHHSTSGAVQSLAEVRMQQQRWGEAAELFSRAADVYRRVDPEDRSGKLQASVDSAATALRRLGREAEADALRARFVSASP